MQKKYSGYISLNDSSLIAAILAGDTVAVEYLLSVQCSGGFYRLCGIYGDTRMELEDLTQEMCLQLLQNDWQMLRHFRGVNAENARPCKLSTYIITCAARWMKRKNDRTVKAIDWSSTFYNGDDRSLEIRDNGHDGEELKRSVIAAIMMLPDALERLVLTEYKLKDRPPEEVARLLNLNGSAKGTVENVYTICSRAMKNLRKLLEKGDVYA